MSELSDLEKLIQAQAAADLIQDTDDICRMIAGNEGLRSKLERILRDRRVYDAYSAKHALFAFAELLTDNSDLRKRELRIRERDIRCALVTKAAAEAKNLVTVRGVVVNDGEEK